MGELIITADDSAALGGEPKENYTRKAEDATISGLWTFENDVRLAGNAAGVQLRLSHFKSWDEGFDDGSMPNGWMWAGAPFVTPGVISFSNPSILTLGLTGATGSERAFLYRTTQADLTHLLCMMHASAVDSFVGIRHDDGTDDNYVEFVVGVSQANPTNWQLILRHRSCGGAVTVVPPLPTTLNMPTALNLIMQVTGTKWTDWNISCQTRGDLIAGLGSFWHAAWTGLAWTPARRGIVVNKAGTTTWFQFFIDAFHPN